jgi:hypothetical protein
MHSLFHCKIITAPNKSKVDGAQYVLIVFWTRVICYTLQSIWASTILSYCLSTDHLLWMVIVGGGRLPNRLTGTDPASFAMEGSTNSFCGSRIFFYGGSDNVLTEGHNAAAVGILKSWCSEMRFQTQSWRYNFGAKWYWVVMWGTWKFDTLLVRPEIKVNSVDRIFRANFFAMDKYCALGMRQPKVHVHWAQPIRCTIGCI